MYNKMIKNKNYRAQKKSREWQETRDLQYKKSRKQLNGMCLR
jgi:hypothetical protein